MYQIHHIKEIDKDIIELFYNCFKYDKIYNDRNKSIFNNKNNIAELFNIFLKNGNILAIKNKNKIIAFMTTINCQNIKNNDKAINIIIDKNKYPEIYTFISNLGFEGNYIVLLGVDQKFRKIGLATKLVNYYLKNIKNSIVFSDVDNKYSYKIFKKLHFQEKAINSNYKIMYKYYKK